MILLSLQVLIKNWIKNLEDNQVLQLITADTDFVRMRKKKKSVNKMVTLPKWLIDLGKEN